MKNIKKTKEQQLEELRKRWNMNCQTAIKDKVAYVLRRSRRDYLKVVGSEQGLDSYQAEVLEQVSGVGTHRQVAIRERQRVADIVRDAFASVEPDTVTGLIGADIVADLLGEFQASIISVSPNMIVTRVDEEIENMNFTNGAVPAPVSAMSHISAGASMGAAVTYSNYDPTSPYNIYTRDMLKAAGHIANDLPLTLEAFNRKFRAGLKKVQSLEFLKIKKVGATVGALSAVTLISLGTSVSAYATVDSTGLYYINHQSTSTSWQGETQTLRVPDYAPLQVIDRMHDIYKPDMIWPTVDGANVIISSGFGYRAAPCATCSSNHQGLDMNPGAGTNVVSATSGTVVLVGWDGSLGWNVLVQDEGNREYAYGHMIANSSPADIYVGAKVVQGQLLGQVGCTGSCTGPHLHFEIREDGVKIDPYPELLKYGH